MDGRILMVPNSRAERSGVQIPHVAPDESALGTEHAESAAQGCSTASGSALPPPIVVANTHVAFDPNKGDVKLGQIRTLFSAAHDLGEQSEQCERLGWVNCSLRTVTVLLV